MKLSILITALALACGGAYAQSGNDGAAAGPNTNDSTTMSQSRDSSSGDSVGKKMKRGVHKLADATRRTGHKIASGLRKATNKDSAQASSDNTSTMGAAPSEDSARRARMDAAYDNFKRKQP